MKIIWVIHSHFADSDRNPERENRLAWKDDDGGTTSASGAPLESSDSRFDMLSEGSEVPIISQGGSENGYDPFKRIRQMVQETQRDVGDKQEFLKKLERAYQSGELVDFLSKDGMRNEIIRTVSENESIGAAFDLESKMRNNPMAARALLGKLFSEEKDPKEKAEAIDEALAELPEEEKGTPSRWQRFLAKLAELGPLYTRLGGFLTNPTVLKYAKGIPSIQTAFAVLKNPDHPEFSRKKLMETLAAAVSTNEFVLRGPGEPEDRLRALEDCSEFISHGMFLLTASEQSEIAYNLSSLKGCIHFMNGHEPFWKEEEVAIDPHEMELTYDAKRKHIAGFKKESEKCEELRGDQGFVEALRKRGKVMDDDPELGTDPDNIFYLLHNGFKTNGWLDELPVPEALKLSAAKITLRKVDTLYAEIAQGQLAERSPEQLIAYVKQVFLNAVRGKEITTKAKEESSIPLPLEEANTTEEDFDAQIEKKQPIKMEDVFDLWLLFTWLEGNGITMKLTKKKLRMYEQYATADTGDLKRDALVRTEQIQGGSALPAVQWGVLAHIAEDDLREALEEGGHMDDCKAYAPVFMERTGERASADWVMRNFVEERLDQKNRRTVIEHALSKQDPSLLLSALQSVSNEQELYESEKWLDDSSVGVYLRTHCNYRQIQRVAEKDRNEPGMNGSSNPRLWLENICPDTIKDLKPLLQRVTPPSGEELVSIRLYAEHMERKRQRKRNWKPSTAVLTYQKRVEELRQEYPKDKRKFAETIAELNEKYDEENAVSQDIHLLQLGESKELLTNALEAQIHYRARELKEQHTEAFEDQEMEDVSELDAYPLLHDHNETDRALTVLEKLDLEKNPEIQTDAAIHQLAFLEGSAKDPTAEAKVRQTSQARGRNAAKALMRLINAGRLLISEETIEWIGECAKEDSQFNGATATTLRTFAKHPDLLKHAEEGATSVEKEAATMNPDTEKICDEMMEWKMKVLERASKAAEPFPNAYGIAQRFSVGGPDYDQKLTIAINEGRIPNLSGRERLTMARQEIHRIEKFARMLETVSEKEYVRLDADAFAIEAEKVGLDGNARGFFDRKELKIVLNKKYTDEQLKGTIIEEEMHAMNYATAKFLNKHIFTGIYQKVESEGGEVAALFKELEKEWIKKRKPGQTDQDFQFEVADELMAKMQVFIRYEEELDALKTGDPIPKHIPLSEKEVQLFTKIKRLGLQNIFPMKDGRGWELKLENLRQAAAQDDHDDGGVAVADEEDGVTNGYVPESTAARDIHITKNTLLKINAFFQSYPEQETIANKAMYDQLEGEFNDIETKYMKPGSEENEHLQHRLGKLKKDLDYNMEKINEFDLAERDIRDAPTRKMDPLLIWRDIQWVSFFDVVAMFKAGADDIKRQFDRRREGRIGKLGENLTDWIPKQIYYVGTLSSEFHRRDKSSEIEEVNKWKEAMKDIDCYELQEQIRHPAHKDHMKAIFEMLSERGRIDWNDVEMWKALSKMSHYDMPFDKCLRNENLREEWLRKMITDIFDDKDHYRDWKSANDGNISSGKKKFSTELDRLNNLDEGIHGELEKQLRIYIEVKERRAAGEKVEMPDDVQPHLYEEALDFAIRMGKLTMEDKFYYLVRGVASGLISTDRLRSFAGEEGGYLNVFPFIDYFYSKNNTMPELIALERRLIEYDGKKDTFKPGIKTTLWLELEVSREKRVQERLRKGIDRKSGEMDHDDMHFFIPRLDAETIDNMAKPSSGGTQKMTGDGWRNAYIGYSSYFKSFGGLAMMEQDGSVTDAKFSSNDIHQIAKASAGFVRMDGILTQRSEYGDNRRPTISFPDMKNSYAVYSSGQTVYEERKQVAIFVSRLVDHYIDDDINGYLNEKVQEGLTASQYKDALLYDTENRTAPSEEQQKLSEVASDKFEQVLKEAIEKKGSKGLKRILINHMPDFHVQGASSKEDYDYNTIKRVWQEGRDIERDFRTGKTSVYSDRN